MEQFAKERDRLLQSAARAIGLGALAVSLVSLAVPGVIEPSSLLPLLPLYAVLAVALVRIGVSQSLIWVGLGLISGTGVLILAQQPLGTGTTPEIATALVPLAGGAMAAFGIVLVGAVHRVLVMAAGLVVSTVLIGLAAPGPG